MAKQIGELRLHGLEPVAVYANASGNPGIVSAARRAGVSGARGYMLRGSNPASVQVTILGGSYPYGNPGRPILATGNFYPDNTES